MLTLWCIAVVCGGILLVGVPVRWLLNAEAPLDRHAWIEAPFLGVAAIVLFTQNLVYLDVPIGRSTWWLWAIVAVLWAWMIKRGAVGPTLAQFPGAVFAPAAAAYVVQGLGLIVAGARHYYGRAWGDQFNYTAIAQFLTDWRFSTTLADLDHHPYAAVAVRLKLDRIGQSVLQGFFSTSTFGDAMLVFEPTILLSPLLITLALAAVVHRYGLSTRTAAITGFCGAVLPAIAMIHLESFLSQALATPFLLYMPVAIDALRRSTQPRRIAITAMLIAATASMYGELMVVLLALAIIGLLLSASPSKWQHRVATIVLLIAAVAVLNAKFTINMLRIVERLDLPVLGHLYPWALRVEGIVRLWFGDVGAAADGTARSLVRAAAMGLTALGYYGLVRAAVADLGGSRDTASSGRVFPVLTLGVALLPIAVLARDDEHPYQFYKLLLTTAPLLSVGLALALKRLSLSLAVASEQRHRPTSTLRVAIATTWTLIAGSSLVGTATMALESASVQPTERSNGHYLRAPDVRALMERLAITRDENIVFAAFDGSWNRGLLNGWIAYYARYNKLWLGNPNINDTDMTLLPDLRDVVAPQTFPSDILVLTTPDTPFPATIPATTESVWASGRFALWRTKPWVYPISLDNPNGMDGDPARRTYWLGGGPSRLRLFASDGGVMSAIVNVSVAESVPGTTHRVRVSTESTDGIVTLSSGVNVFEIAVRAGANDIEFEALQEAPPSIPGKDGRPLVIGLSDTLFTFERDWVMLSRVENPNGLELLDHKPFFWLGGGPTRLELWSGAAGTVEVRMETVPGPSIPNNIHRRIRVEYDEGFDETLDTIGGSVSFRLLLGAGKRSVTLTPLDSATVVLAHDSRPLIVGVKDLTARRVPDELPSEKDGPR